MIEKYNNELKRLFRSSEFNSFLMSKVNYCPGNPTIYISDRPNGSMGMFIEYSTENEYSDTCESPTVPSEKICNICLEFLKMKNTEIYNYVTSL